MREGLSHPFEKLSQKHFRLSFRVSLGITVVMLIILSVLGIPLQQCRTALGGACDIVSFELAGTPAYSGAIVDAWRQYEVLPYARWNTWLDYVFMGGYSNCVALGLLWLLRFPFSPRWRNRIRLLAWAQWLVLAADALENAALLYILYRAAVSPWPQVAFACAVIKFGLLGAGLLCLVIGFWCRKRTNAEVAVM